MPPRRVRERDERLAPGVRLYARWEIEHVVVRFAVVLLVREGGAWHAVDLFDCSHDGQNDHHRYAPDGTKGRARLFHHGTPSEAMNDAIDLIKADHERMIERWRR